MFLPNYCWERIFNSLNDDHHSYLEPLSLVSKHFLSITNHLRYSLTLSEHNIPYITHLFARFPNIRCLIFKGLVGNHLDTVMQRVSEANLSLTSIDISHHEIFPYVGFVSIARKIKSLKKFQCSNMSQLSNRNFNVIVNFLPFLEELNISNSPVSTLSMSALCKLTNLKQLDLSGNIAIEDSILMEICTSCLFLEELSIKQCPYLSQEGIASAIRTLLGPISLSMGCISRGLGVTFLSQLTTLTSIEIVLTAISDGFLISMVETNLQLNRILLQGCTGFTFDGIYKLLSNCPRISVLSLEDTGFLADEDISNMCQLLGKLTYIQLGDCPKLTTKSVDWLLRACPLLHKMMMNSCSVGEIKDRTYVISPQLRYLSLAYNAELSDEFFRMFHFPTLQELDLTSCRHLSDDSLSAISEFCFGVLFIKLDKCRMITHKGVKKFVQKCQTLREISLNGYRRVAGHVVDWMLRLQPTIRRIYAPYL